MAVSSKLTRVPEIALGYRGAEIKVHDGAKQLGDLYVKKSEVEWCEGGTQEGNGVKISYADLNWIAFYKDEVMATVKAARKRDKR